MKQRLQKCIAQATGISRRKAEELISSGKVSVNGILINQQGTSADLEFDEITIEGQIISAPEKKTYLMLNKPTGYITSRSDPNGRKTVMDLLSKEQQKLFPVGRLDFDSEGLLLMTDDGIWANEIIHPRYEVEKEYEITTEHPITLKDQHQCVKGLELEDGLGKFLSIRNLENESLPFTQSSKHSAIHHYSVIVEEGRNRFIRRMVAALNNKVLTLKRIRISRLHLGQLPYGKTRELTENEVAQLSFLSHKKIK